MERITQILTQMDQVEHTHKVHCNTCEDMNKDDFYDRLFRENWYTQSHNQAEMIKNMHVENYEGHEVVIFDY